LGDLDALGVRVWAISADGLEDARKMADDVPQFAVISDPDAAMIKAFGVLHSGGGPKGTDIAYPTHVVVDGTGVIRDIWRAPRNTDRRLPEDVIATLRGLNLR
jgi:peroxiredoxin